jgi:glycosyltransferase involved in cell wall biosynthesis
MRVAVIIPVLNGAVTIAGALHSVLDQEFDEPYEVIVVDDGSTDTTPQILRELVATQRAPIKVVTQVNRGLAAARNAGAAAAAGDVKYLAFLDADDAWLPDKLARSIDQLDQNPGAVLLYTDILAVDDQGQPASRSLMPRRETHAPSMADLLSKWWPIIPSTAVVRRAAFDRCGRFCEDFRGAEGHEDVDLWLRLRELGEFIYLDQPLVKYRVSPIGDQMLKYQTNFALFTRRVAERYGRRGRPLLHAMRHGYATALSYRGLIALRDGDRATARSAFLRALAYHPWHLRTTLRFARTFLPRSLARALTANSRRRIHKPA